MFLSLFSAFVRGDLECLREWADVSTPFSSPQLRSILSLELTEKHPEPESQNLLQWPGSSRWKILFPVSFSPCFLLKVSPLAVTIRSQPPTYCVVFHYYRMVMQNIIVLLLCHRVWKPVCSVWERNESPEGNSLSCLIPTESPTGHTQVTIFCHESIILMG